MTFCTEFNVVGSVAEGTRIGLGNEVDLTLTFAKWKTGAAPFAVHDDDAFHLYKVGDWRQQSSFLINKVTLKRTLWPFGRGSQSLGGAVVEVVTG